MSLKLSVLDQSVAMSGINSRRNPLELVPGYEEEEQAISLKDASPLFTTQAARSIKLEHVKGGLKAGFLKFC